MDKQTGFFSLPDSQSGSDKNVSAGWQFCLTCLSVRQYFDKTDRSYEKVPGTARDRPGHITCVLNI